MRKWYFAYHSYHGMTFPVAWAEDNGICVGGRPRDIIEDAIWEITEEMFNNGFTKLERLYPVPVVIKTIDITCCVQT